MTEDPVRVLTRGLLVRAAARALLAGLLVALSLPPIVLLDVAALALATVVERALLLRALRRQLPAWRCGVEVGLALFVLLAAADVNMRWAETPGDLDAKVREVATTLRWDAIAQILTISWLLVAPLSGLAVAAHEGVTRAGGLAHALAPPRRMGPWTLVWPLVWAAPLVLLTLVGLLPPTVVGISPNQSVQDRLLTAVFVIGAWWVAALSVQLVVHLVDRVAWWLAPDLEPPAADPELDPEPPAADPEHPAPS